MTKETAMKILKELHDKSLFAERTAIETIIPELNEDEKIREMLIDSFTRADMGGEIYGKGVTYKQVIAWLEKQEDKEYVFRPLAGCDIESAAIQAVEQQKLGKKIVLAFNGAYIPVEEKTTDDIVNEYYSWLEKQGQTFTKKDVDDAYLKGICDAKHELEKQGKQKPPVIDFKANNWYVSKVDGKIYDMTYNPTDNIEPKFKVGDILVRKEGNGFLYPVIDMDDKYYVIRAFHKPRAIEKKECEEFFKLVRRRENGKLIE